VFRVSELGLRLKSAREEKGYTHEELQQITKIQKRYLIAIEEGDFSKMPGEFYGRAFVKSYSEAVGLDPDMIFEEHKDELPQPKREPSDLPPRVNRSKPQTVRKKTKFASYIPTIVAVLFILAIAAGLWALRQDGGDGSAGVSRQDQERTPSVELTDSVENENYEENNEEIDANNEENGNENQDNVENTENENNEDNEEEIQEQTLAHEDTQGERSIYSLMDTDSFEVTMMFTGDSWLQILDSDGEQVHQQTHGNNDEISFDFTDESEIIFNMGNVRTAEIYVNDELLEYYIDDHRQYVTIQYGDS
jgi:cytoskeletal protein RodZ